MPCEKLESGQQIDANQFTLKSTKNEQPLIIGPIEQYRWYHMRAK